MDLAFSLSGFVVGVLVGFTGMGGGSVMTPLLVLLFGVHPVTAVGTDLFFAAATKATGTRVHAHCGTIDWRIAGRLAAGSIPGTLFAIFLMTRLPLHSPALANAITAAIGVALLIAAAGLLFGKTARRPLASGGKAAAALRPKIIAGLTVVFGFMLGVLVSLTSVGAGAVGLVVLRQLYPRVPTVRLVGSDVAHAVPLTLLAGSGHWLMGDINWLLLGSLLLGSIPGVILASRTARHVPDDVLRRVLGVVLLGIAAPMLIA